VIDRPILPLKKEKFGKVKGILLGRVLWGFNGFGIDCEEGVERDISIFFQV
jgi:hypothetical protein